MSSPIPFPGEITVEKCCRAWRIVKEAGGPQNMTRIIEILIREKGERKVVEVGGEGILLTIEAGALVAKLITAYGALRARRGLIGLGLIGAAAVEGWILYNTVRDMVSRAIQGPMADEIAREAVETITIYTQCWATYGRMLEQICKEQGEQGK